MPAITPQEWGPGFIVRHAVSQGYVLHKQQLRLAPEVGGNIWVPVNEMTMTVTIDEPSTVLQLLRCTVLLGFVGGQQMHLRLRYGSNVGIHQTAEHDPTGAGTDGHGITLFRVWPDVQPGQQSFGLDVRYPYPTQWAYTSTLFDLRMVLAVLKR